MAVTDDIVEEIARLCEESGMKEFSLEIIREDYLTGYAVEFMNEIKVKLKAKGIEVS